MATNSNRFLLRLACEGERSEWGWGGAGRPEVPEGGVGTVDAKEMACNGTIFLSFDMIADDDVFTRSAGGRGGVGRPDVPAGGTDAWIDMHMIGQPPCEGARSAGGWGRVGRPEVPAGGKVAAARAMASAKMNPGMLFKITCRTREEVIATVEALSIMVSSLNFLADKDCLSSRSKEGWPILELKNKSGIMIVINKKKGDTSG